MIVPNFLLSPDFRIDFENQAEIVVHEILPKERFHLEGERAVAAAIHLNDDAAIRSARKLAHAHRFEVWRGMDCIYGTEGAPIFNLRSARRPGA